MNCTPVANSEGPVTCTTAFDSQASACLPGYTRSAGIPTICSGMWVNDEAVFQLPDQSHCMEVVVGKDLSGNDALAGTKMKRGWWLPACPTHRSGGPL
jgi:hypothetical protein